MKKIVLFFALLLSSSMALRAQDLSELVEGIQQEFEAQGKEIENDFKSQGVDLAVSTRYDAPEKTIVIDMHFMNPLFIQFINNQILEESRQSFMDGYVNGSGNDEEDYAILKTLADNNAKLKLLFSSDQDSKSVDIPFTEVLEYWNTVHK